MADPPESSGERLLGYVKWFNSVKGFGFITVEGSEDEIFVHQSNIETAGFRSLREGEEVEFDLVVSEDGKKKAFNVTGPGGAPPQGSGNPQMLMMRGGFSGRGGAAGPGRGAAYDPVAYAAAAAAAAGGFGGYSPSPGAAGRGRGTPPGGFWPSPEAAYMGYYMGPGGMGPQGATTYYPVFPRGRGGFFPGGRNWAGARPPPPGQPGFSSGLQVVVHNLPWDCTWQQLKDAFSSCGEIERADVVFDSRGRSRGFGIVRFPDPECAERAVERMNNATIGGRVVSVRVDRFA